MLSDSQKLTDGLIIYSALISDFEKLDFKNDALAGVRANYFNSRKLPQYDKTEISFDDKLYNISYHMTSDMPLSWKVTRNNRPYQSVKKFSGGIYCVIFYGENGIINKRTYFDDEHIWLRTEYYDGNFENVKVAVLYPKYVCGVNVLSYERIDSSGKSFSTLLYPSSDVPKKRCKGLIYSNVGMLWFDESFKPEDMYDRTESDDDRDCGGFKFNKQILKNADVPSDFLDMSNAEYLNESDFVSENSDAAESRANSESSSEYSAYDKIANILSEAHKTNKYLFGEIINQTSDGLLENGAEDAGIMSGVEAAGEFSAEPLNTEPGEITADEGTTSVQIPDVTEISENFTESNDGKDESSSETDKELDFCTMEAEETTGGFESREKPECDVVIRTKSGGYAYFGELDANNNRTGRGRTVAPDGYTSYDGEYLDDKRNGFGVCYYKEGGINYVGNWSDGSRNGCGVGYRQSDGTMHAGKWLDNAPDGLGARFDSDGNFVDICSYSNGKRSGKSVSFDEQGRIVVKKWEDGELVSEYIADEA